MDATRLAVKAVKAVKYRFFKAVYPLNMICVNQHMGWSVATSLDNCLIVRI